MGNHVKKDCVFFSDGEKSRVSQVTRDSINIEIPCSIT